MRASGKRTVKGDTYYGKVARNYQKRRARQPWWQVEQREMAALLDSLPRGLSVLDVPFGTGRFVPFYLERGYAVHGLDASVEMIAQAAEILGDAFAACQTTTGTATELPFEDKSFDLFVSTRFLRDIVTFDDARRALAECARVTRGHAIVQLGETTAEAGHVPDGGEAMGSHMDAAQIDALLAGFGLTPVQRRPVKHDPEEASVIHHILCRVD